MSKDHQGPVSQGINEPEHGKGHCECNGCCTNCKCKKQAQVIDIKNQAEG